jgi:CheY-like chemotaxis protein
MGEIIELSAQKARVAPASGLQILIVEDEALVALMIEDMLTALRCRVAGSARSVREALRLIEERESALDGAILDVSLGEEKVYAVAEALQARGVPFVFATGYDADSLDARFAHCATLAKPFELIALDALVRQIFSRAA